jgi:hypothetical protein
LTRFTDVLGEFLVKVGRRVEVPLQIIFEHLLVTIASLLSIWMIEFVLRILGLGNELVPFTSLPLHQLLLLLDVIASTGIIAIGLFKAARELLE